MLQPPSIGKGSTAARKMPAFGMDMRAPERAGQMLVTICNPFCKTIQGLHLAPKMVCHFLTSLSWAGTWRVATLLRICGSVRNRSTWPARIAVIGIPAGAHDRTSCVPGHAREPAEHQHYQTDRSQPYPFTRDTGPDQRQCRHQDDDLCVQKIERVRAQPRV